ncbi:MAG TPA: hypothetical protein VLK65_26530 [Vicinamibacteria bacterium]|nr:hypothetical protein [Vicinamibacteria bacterium]
MNVVSIFAVLATVAACTAVQGKEMSVAPPQPSTGQSSTSPEEQREPEEPSTEQPTQEDHPGASGSAASDLPAGSVKTTDERRDDLDEELDESLREFDKLILREQEILEERHEASAAEAAANAEGEGSAGGGGSGGDGDRGDDGSLEGTAEAGGEESPGGTGGSPDSPEYDETGAPTDSSDATAETRNGRVPPDVGDGSDDDIVARQLREAAMSEDDPELREKLWDEYRSYKAGLKKKK